VNKKYKVSLMEEEREELHKLIRTGKAAAHKIGRARIVLKADEGWKDEAIVAALDVSIRTVERVRQQFVEEGLEAALNRRKTRRVYERRLAGEQEAQLIALTCSQPPAGQKRWTMQLLADKLVELGAVETVSDETVRQALKKMNSSRG
jgi:transposase